MPFDFQQDAEIRDATRLHNRALRTVNKSVKKKLDRVQREADETIAALFDAPSEADIAFNELYVKLDIHHISPKDYTGIVDYILNSVSAEF